MDGEDEFDYDIAFSFAGEDREIVERLAAKLVEDDIRVFYDSYEKAALWGKDLYQHLQSVYRDKARYCVIFASASYARKVWTRHELKQAQARAFKENREYILPVRLDDTEIPGLNATVGYIDLRQHTVEELHIVLREKLFGAGVEDEDLAELTWKGDRIEFRGQEVASFWPQSLARYQLDTTYVVKVPRVRYGDERRYKDSDTEREFKNIGVEWNADSPCHDCAAIKGEYHARGCDWEECPACGGQALGCECIVE